MRVAPVLVGMLVVGLACGGAATESGTSEASANPCPVGTKPSSEEQDGGLVLCKGKTGSVAYLRDGVIVARGAMGGEYGSDRIGHWVSLGPDENVRANGNFGSDGKPTGEWRFPDLERTWKDGWEPRSPMVTLLWEGGLHAGEHTIEVLDADLAKERVALRRIATYECPNCEQEEKSCGYPGLPAMAGATLRLVQPGVAEPLGSWDVYRMPGTKEGCSGEAEAGPVLAAAKEAIAGAGLDVTQRPALVPATESKEPNGLGAGAWSFAAPGHTVTLAEIPRPGVDVELTVPDLALRDWTYDSAYGDRTYFYELAVDGRPAWRFVYATFTTCAGGGTLRPEGLIVEDDLAALVLTGVWTSCDGASYRTVVSPVFSMKEPKGPAF